ncbi:FtsK/SpoIIIE domain-containing protein [Liquorilactobacillus sicerae]|uniref:FtsK/SpoIIIE domain-containing protein n=1 Tax=Liquorilactobacillus sicerae TaxID=1416943 RepID=UPI002480F395|nr:FtsK/SpoIIIE domain-containing protein [Liquorilactobacillus sicerae]
MWGLLKERRARIRGDTKFVSLYLPNNFINYRRILKFDQTWLIVILLFWFFCGFVSNNWLAEIFVCVTGIPILLKQYKYFKNLRHFFRYEYETDYKLLNFIQEADLDESTVIVYEENSSELLVRFLKSNNPTLINQLENLEKPLASVFGILPEKRIDTQSVDYLFTLVKLERLVVTATEKPEFTNNMNIDLGYGVVYNPVKSPHVLIGGGTGSGKSIFISFFLIELMKRHATTFICDPKNSDLGNLSHYLDDHVAVTPNNIARVTRLAVEEMKKRYSIMNDSMNFKYGSNFVDHGFNPLWLIFDEMGAFQASATDKEGKKIVDETMANIKQIILLGRQAGCFILVAAQQMRAETLNSDLRDNLGLRIALGANSPDGYRMIFNSHTPPTDSFPDVSVKGSGMIYVEGSGESQAKYWESPFIDTTKFDFIEELLKYKTADKYFSE